MAHGGGGGHWLAGGVFDVSKHCHHEGALCANGVDAADFAQTSSHQNEVNGVKVIFLTTFNAG